MFHNNQVELLDQELSLKKVKNKGTSVTYKCKVTVREQEEIHKLSMAKRKEW